MASPIFVPVGSSLPEQLALEAIAQVARFKGSGLPASYHVLSSIGSITRPILESFGDVAPGARGRSASTSSGGLQFCSAADIRRKDELLTNLGEDEYYEDYIDYNEGDSYQPFINDPKADIDKLSKVTYGEDESFNVKLKALVEELEDVFSMTLPSEPARLPPFHLKVNLEKWESSSNRLPPRVQSRTKNEKIRELTTELMNNGVNQHSQAEYYSQAVLAPKPHTNKTEWRFCQDFRNLNDASEFQSWPLPNTSHMFERIGAKKPKYFGILDLTQGFHQIAMSPESRKFTAYITHAGLQEYTRVPFGLKGAPPYFQQNIARIVLKDLLYVICELYIDDIIVYGATQEEFLENLRKILERMRQYNVKIKPSKVKLGLTTVEYVGRTIHEDGTTMQDEKTRKVLDFPLPDYVKQLRSFNGLAEYFRPHVYGNLSEVMRPLRNMVQHFEKAKTKLKWDTIPGAAEAFHKTKELIAMRAKLFFYDEDAPIFLLTDASDFGIGGYLYQIVDGKEQPVAFVSKSLTGPQLRWPTIQKEAYAIYYCITKLEYLLRDRSFCLMTDHANLTYINKTVNAMVQRWKTALGSYDFVVKHISGVRNIVADYLSRLVKNHMLEQEPDNELVEEAI